MWRACQLYFCYHDSSLYLVCSILSSIPGPCTKDDFQIIHFYLLVLFSAALVELAKSTPDHLSHLFFCLPLLLFPFTVPSRIVFAKLEGLEALPNHFPFLGRDHDGLDSSKCKEIELHFNYRKADDKIFVCHFSKNVKSKPYHIENQRLEGKQCRSTLFANSAVFVTGS